MNKLRIAFDPTTIWDREDFRNIVKDLVKNPEVEVYIVTKNTSTSLINTVVSVSEMDPNKVYQVLNNDTVVTKLDMLQIQIYMSGDNPLIRLVDAHSGSSTGVLVNDIVDNNRSQMMYITKLQFWIKTIARENNG